MRGPQRLTIASAATLLSLSTLLLTSVPLSHARPVSRAVRTDTVDGFGAPRLQDAQQRRPSETQIAAAKRRITALNTSLRALSPFVHMSRDGFETFRADRARRARHSTEMIALASELVAYQNALLRRARQIKQNGNLPSVALAEYPRVQGLFTTATVAAFKELRAQRPGPVARSALNLSTLQPCGDWATPRPTTSPNRTMAGPFKDVRAALRKSGYHPTAGYACGRSSIRYCPGDYTRQHEYKSRAGVCSAPRFRDQAHPSATHRGYVRVQYGEPNPEIAGYNWPYWNWGAYVVWWHRNY